MSRRPVAAGRAFVTSLLSAYLARAGELSTSKPNSASFSRGEASRRSPSLDRTFSKRPHPSSGLLFQMVTREMHCSLPWQLAPSLKHWTTHGGCRARYCPMVAHLLGVDDGGTRSFANLDRRLPPWQGSRVGRMTNSQSSRASWAASDDGRLM